MSKFYVSSLGSYCGVFTQKEYTFRANGLIALRH